MRRIGRFGVALVVAFTLSGFVAHPAFAQGGNGGEGGAGGGGAAIGSLGGNAVNSNQTAKDFFAAEAQKSFDKRLVKHLLTGNNFELSPALSRVFHEPLRPSFTPPRPQPASDTGSGTQV